MVPQSKDSSGVPTPQERKERMQALIERSAEDYKHDSQYRKRIDQGKRQEREFHKTQSDLKQEQKTAEIEAAAKEKARYESLTPGELIDTLYCDWLPDDAQYIDSIYIPRFKAWLESQDKSVRELVVRAFKQTNGKAESLYPVLMNLNKMLPAGQQYDIKGESN